MGKKHLRGYTRAWEKKYDKRKYKRKDIPLCCQINPHVKCTACNLTVCSFHFANMLEGAPGKKKYCPIPRPPKRPQMTYDMVEKKYVVVDPVGTPSKIEPMHNWSYTGHL